MRLGIPATFAYTLICVIGCLLAGVASADTITFEEPGIGEGENVYSFGSGQSISSYGFTSTSDIAVTIENFSFAKYGGPRHAFGVWNHGVLSSDGVVYDRADTGPFANPDNWFITDLSPGGDSWVDPGGDDITITFGTPVKDLSFLVADLESLGANEFERMVATAYGSDGVLETITRDGGTASGLQHGGDGEVQTVSFEESGIKKLVIDVNRWDSTLDNGDGGVVTNNNRFGVGYDNLTFTAVPTPGALAGLASMTMIGLVGLGLRRWRRR